MNTQESSSLTSPLTFDNALIERNADNHLMHISLVELATKQILTEAWIRFSRGINFRKRTNQDAVDAYASMSVPEFEGINLKQQWGNWRTVPKNLSGILPNRPLNVIDLCSGVGHSTEVLACYLPPGSQILGLEYNEQLVKKALAKKYFHMSGQEVDANFRVQNVLESFRDHHNNLIESESVDLINSNGAVGVHFDVEATKIIAKEVHRVLKPGGLANIDCGIAWLHQKPRFESVVEAFTSLGFRVLRQTRSFWIDPHFQVCYEKLNR